VETLAAGASATQIAVSRARQLLERYGVVSREAAQAENVAGGFAPLYRVFKAMEEAGQIRRGYFVEGLTGAQFAHAGAVDRLRAARPDEEGDDDWTEGDVVLLSAIDPANPYGALLPWPVHEDSVALRPRRVPGATVFLVGGSPILYAARRGRQLLTFPFPGRPPEEMLRIAIPRLRDLPRPSGKRRLLIEEMDGRRVTESPHIGLLRECGFERSYRGLVDVKA
jgi:ATP-dependent Lhr-like helicase